MCGRCVAGQGAQEGWARLHSEDLQQAALPQSESEPWQPALILPSLRGPVLSCPEALHCAQLGAAQYKMRRGGRQPAGSKRAAQPSAPCTAPTGLLPPPRPPPGLSGPSSKAEQEAGGSHWVSAFLKKKSRARMAFWACRSAELLLLNISQHLDNLRIGRADRRVKLALRPQQL